jgi:hypothetical protein
LSNTIKFKNKARKLKLRKEEGKQTLYYGMVASVLVLTHYAILIFIRGRGIERERERERGRGKGRGRGRKGERKIERKIER